MKQYILFILLFIPLISSCQEKYNQKPYDDEEVRLRKADINDTTLVMQKDWEKRDSLSYLRFRYTNRITFVDVDSIPNWINSFKILKYITVMGSGEIKRLPDNLKNINILWFYNATLNDVTYCIYNLQKLYSLGLNGNGENSIDKEIIQLQKLNSLSLYNFKFIPINDICEIKTITHLYLNRCNLTNVPRAIKGLTNLEELSIKSNNITELPKELLELPRLREISYDEDKITDEDFKKRLYEHVEKNRVAYRKQQMEEEQNEIPK